MVKGARLVPDSAVASVTPFGGPGSKSKKSSASTRARRTSPVSMYILEVSGVSRSMCAVGGSSLPSGLSKSDIQKYARSFESKVDGPGRYCRGIYISSKNPNDTKT
jgi:hypothetical protein